MQARRAAEILRQAVVFLSFDEHTLPTLEALAEASLAVNRATVIIDALVTSCTTAAKHQYAANPKVRKALSNAAGQLASVLEELGLLLEGFDQAFDAGLSDAVDPTWAGTVNDVAMRLLAVEFNSTGGAT